LTLIVFNVPMGLVLTTSSRESSDSGCLPLYVDIETMILGRIELIRPGVKRGLRGTPDSPGTIA